MKRVKQEVEDNMVKFLLISDNIKESERNRNTAKTILDCINEIEK